MAKIGVIEHADGTTQYACSQCGYSSDNRHRVNGHVASAHKRKPAPVELEPESPPGVADVVALLDELRAELMRLREFERAVLAAVGSPNGQ